MATPIGQVLDKLEIGKNTVKRHAGVCELCGGELVGVRSPGGEEYNIQECGRCQIERIKANEEKVREDKMRMMAWYRVVDEKYRDMQWGDFSTSKPWQKFVFTGCQNWIDEFQCGHWLVMYGRQGTGKTMLKNLLIKDLCRKGYKVCSTTMRDMHSTHIAAVKGESPIQRPEIYYSSFDVLVVDEVGRSTATESLKQFMFSVTDRIYRNGKSMMLLSNLMVMSKDGEQEKRSIADFVDYERLVEQSTFLPFTGDTFRVAKQ